jgi:hypothetical protein
MKLQYLPYFPNNFQINYTGESGIEREKISGVKKLLNFKGYISGGQQNPKFWRSFKASEFNGNAALYP